MLYCDNHRTGLFLFVYFKIYLVQNHSRKKPLSRENGRLCFRDEQGLNLITAKFRKGKETAPLSLITDARWTKVHMHYAWGNLKKLYEKFKLWLFVIALKKKLKKTLSPLAITFIYQLFQCYAFKRIAIFSLLFLPSPQFEKQLKDIPRYLSARDSTSWFLLLIDMKQHHIGGRKRREKTSHPNLLSDTLQHNELWWKTSQTLRKQESLEIWSPWRDRE